MIYRIVSILVILLISTSAFPNSNCTLKSRTCIDSTPCKQVSSFTVCLADIGETCWDYKNDYSCLQPDSVDYCAAINSTPGCTLQSKTCIQSDFNGNCMKYTQVYQCTGTPTNTNNVVVLDSTYTIKYDNVDITPCQDYSSNSSCVKASSVCVEGPQTRNINGLNVFRDCWRWQDQYSCVVNSPSNFCQGLRSSGCVVQSDRCTSYAFTGACSEREFIYRCGDPVSPLPQNTVYLNDQYTVMSDKIKSTCGDMDTNANCVLASEICTQGPETRVINGLSVYKDCWEWDRKYTCASDRLQSTCGDLRSNPLCSETKSECLSNLPNGQCGHLEHEFKCADGVGSTSTRTNCGSQRYCSDGNCYDTGFNPDGDFGLAIANMEGMREAATYGIFKGEANFCGSNALKNCCKSSSGGASSSNHAVAQQLGSAVLKVGAEVIWAEGSTYLFEALVDSALPMISQYVASSAASCVVGTSTNFSIWGAAFSYSTNTGFAFVGFDPWSLAAAVLIYVVMDLSKCEQEDQLLAMKRGQGLCHKVGSFCSGGGKACTSKKEGWCCFPSKLGRIIQEQGRAQIGKSWGTGNSPDCSGFTLNELGLLRFDQMDLSEFINDIVAGSRSNSFAVDRVLSRPASYYRP